MKQKIEGLYLWAVPISYLGEYVREGTQLWITTRSNSIEQVSKKTRALLKRRRAEWPSAEIKGIKSHGTIDA